MPSNPDLALHPSATGAAYEFAQAHSTHAPPSSTGLTLYGSWFCPFVQRVWITLHLKQIAHRYVEINPYRKDPDFLARNPRGLVPTLAIAPHKHEESSKAVNAEEQQVSPQNEKILYESSIVCEYLDSLYPNPALFSGDAFNKARQKIWIDHISSRIIPSFYRFIQHTPEKNYTLESAREELVERIKVLVKEMCPQGPWFDGDKIGMVDVAVIPWAKRLFLLDHYKGGSGVPNGDEEANADAKGGADEQNDAKIWTRWHKWLDAVEKHPSVVATMSDREKYIDAYKRYAEDTTGSEVGQATRGGRGLP